LQVVEVEETDIMLEVEAEQEVTENHQVLHLVVTQASPLGACVSALPVTALQVIQLQLELELDLLPQIQ
jgi:hypothetical protein